MASLFGGPTPTRPLILHSSSARVTIPVPASPLSAWIASETLAQEFHDSRVGLDEAEPVAEVEEGVAQVSSTEPQIKLLSRFLVFVSDRLDKENSDVLLAAYDRFNELFLSVVNIHSLVQSFDPETRAEVLTSYFKAFATARGALGESKVKLAHTSALIESAKKGDSELYALFGGQGSNEVSQPKLDILSSDMLADVIKVLLLRDPIPIQYLHTLRQASS